MFLYSLRKQLGIFELLLNNEEKSKLWTFFFLLLNSLEFWDQYSWQFQKSWPILWRNILMKEKGNHQAFIMGDPLSLLSFVTVKVLEILLQDKMTSGKLKRACFLLVTSARALTTSGILFHKKKERTKLIHSEHFIKRSLPISVVGEDNF